LRAHGAAFTDPTSRTVGGTARPIGRLVKPRSPHVVPGIRASHGVLPEVLMPDRCARRRAGILLAVAAVSWAASAADRRLPADRASPQAVNSSEPAVTRGPEDPLLAAPVTAEIGKSVRGRPIEAIVFEGTSGCILILGSIHGDEPLAGALVERVVEYLKAHPDARANRTVVLIAHANPDGLAAGTHANAHGVDLNRNFPARNFTAHARHGSRPLSEPESAALAAAIKRYQPSCVISVHGPLGCIDPDGGDASSALAREMALYSPLPVKSLSALPGSLGSYAGNELHLRMITYELDRRSMSAANAGAYLDRHLKPLLVAIEKCSPGPSSSPASLARPVRRDSTSGSTRP